MKKFLPFLFCLVFVFSACKKQTAERAAEHELVPGAYTSVILSGNPTTGYTWTLENKDALEYMTLISQEIKKINSEDGKAGSPSSYEFNFTVNEGPSGRTQILKFIYSRPWEKDIPPVQEKIYEIKIK
jgi:predicted secreted protein